MRPLVRERRDDPGLAVVPAQDLDAGGGSGLRRAALGDRDQGRACGLAAGELQPGPGAVAVEANDLVRRGKRERARPQPLEPAQQRAADQPVLDDVSERLVADRPVVVVHGRAASAARRPGCRGSARPRPRAPARRRSPRADTSSPARSRSRGRRTAAPWSRPAPGARPAGPAAPRRRWRRPARGRSCRRR